MQKETKAYDVGSLRRSEWIGGLLYWPMFLVGSTLLAYFLVRWFWPTSNEALKSARVNLTYGVLNLVLVLPIFRRYLADQLRRLIDSGWSLFGHLFLGLLAYFGLTYAAAWAQQILTPLFGVTYANANQSAVESYTRTVPGLAIVQLCLLAPLTEEVLTRGLFFVKLHDRSRFWAYAVSMLVFSLAHCWAVIPLQPIGVTLLNVLAYLPAGWVLAWVYERSGSLWTSVFLHALINAIALLAQILLRRA